MKSLEYYTDDDYNDPELLVDGDYLDTLYDDEYGYDDDFSEGGEDAASEDADDSAEDDSSLPPLGLKLTFNGPVQAEPQVALTLPEHTAQATPAARDLGEVMLLDVEKPDTSKHNDEPIIKAAYDRGITLTDEEVRDPQKVVRTIELQHYARRAPHLAEQKDDTSRTNTFSYREYFSGKVTEMTEHEGLVGLEEFLRTNSKQGGAREHTERLRDIHDNLTFIGEKELAEAAAGIGVLWKDYLAQNPDNKLCVPILLSHDNPEKIRKSDEFLLGRVLDTFSDDELAAFRGRIITDLAKLRASGTPPENAKIVLLEDWTISGNQLQAIVKKMAVPENEAYLGIARTQPENVWEESERFLKTVEANLVTANSDVLEHGFRIFGATEKELGHDTRVPVKAYYKANGTRSYARQTGTHSSVDYGFEEDIRNAVVAQGNAEMPPLTGIQRAYRTEQPRVVVAEDGSLVRTKFELTK